MAHVAEYKKKEVAELAKLFKEYPVIGIINMDNLPTPQLQKMRAQLRDTVNLRMSKKRLIKLALEKVEKQNIKELEKHLEGMPALLFTKEEPFKIALILRKSKSSAPAKPGQTAPRDIIIPAGPTGFTPGPIISELGQAGIKAGVDKGKIVVKEEKLVAKKGEKISHKIANLLTKFGIEPMEIGLNISAIYDDGVIYAGEVLDVDDKKLVEELKRAALWAFNLAVEVGYPSKGTISFLISKAYMQANAVAQLEKSKAAGR